MRVEVANGSLDVLPFLCFLKHTMCDGFGLSVMVVHVVCGNVMGGGSKRMGGGGQA